jgi:GDP-4-dehydro-6-deoxy-D-mannose reductase
MRESGRRPPDARLGSDSDVKRRILVTGAAGFAGSHLLDRLERDTSAELVAWRRPGERLPAGRSDRDGSICWVTLDLRDRDAVDHAVAEAQPAVIYHLAGAAHVGASWAKTADALAINALGTHYLLDAVRRAGLTPRVLIPSSAYVYRPSDTAMDESAPVQPNSPYGFSKLAQEMAGLKAFAEAGIPVVLSRSFNHVGPRQDPSFSTSSFAKQIATVEAGGAEPVILVGNLDARRDLTDVRDTVRAYQSIVERGTPGRVYNVCSGVAYRVADVLNGLLAAARVRIDVRVDPARFRPNDMPVVLGDHRRLLDELGWRPEIPFDQTLHDLLDYWRGVVAGN